MIRKIPFRLAVNTMLFFLSVLLVYHLLIITQAIPYEATWGGRLKSDEEMYRFEAVSITVNLLIMFVIAIKGGYTGRIKPNKLIKVILWLMVVLYALNTVGNILSTNLIETIVFTPMTLIFTVLCWRMAIE